MTQKLLPGASILLVSVALSSCVFIINPPPPPEPVPVGAALTCINDTDAPVAHIYFVARVERSTVNLKSAYGSIMTRTAASLTAAGILPTVAVLVRADERPVQKKGLLAAWGCNLDDPSELTPEQVIEYYAQEQLDAAPIGCATDPLVAIGASLADLTTDYPQGLPGRSGRSVFSGRPDIVLVVHFDERARRSSYEDSVCSGARELSVENEEETAPWLHYVGGPPPAEKVIHWFITTEEGVERDTFIAQCKKYEGFPTSTLDILEPSANVMWTPLASAIDASGQNVTTFPLCAALTDHELNPFFMAEIPAIARIAGTAADLDALSAILGGMLPPELTGGE